jgi:LysM repeat protein
MRALKILAASAGLVLPSCDDNSQYAALPSGQPRDANTYSAHGSYSSVTAIAHTVAKGETLSTIGKKYNLDWKEIARQNGIEKPYTIYFGQELYMRTRAWEPQQPSEGASHEASHLRQNLSDLRPPPESRSYEALPSYQNIAALSMSYMPEEARPYLEAMSSAVMQYCEQEGLKRTGRPMCGQGVCTIMSSIVDDLSVLGQSWNVPALDRQFTNKSVYTQNFGSPSRDAYKIRAVLEHLSTRSDSGWVRLKLKDLPVERDYVDNHRNEGKHYLPSSLPGGAVLLYDPAATSRGKRADGEGQGHIEFVTEKSNGDRWFAFTAYTPVHGGSRFCRTQFDRHMENRGVFCYAFVLVTPEVKQRWCHNQSEAGKLR